ncbi:MAG TPA: alginate lyase family protein [Rhizomicrobium sp.]|jgi:hypothetical protein|nr:alginate lyase family protein [Rhizomicrobium sp.]
MKLFWYVRRLAAMGPREAARRLVDRIQNERRWRRLVDGRSSAGVADMDWYIRRLAGMGRKEISRRLVDQIQDARHRYSMALALHPATAVMQRNFTLVSSHARAATAPLRRAKKLFWFVKRLAAMGPEEIAHRFVDRFHEAQWRQRYFGKNKQPVALAAERHFIGCLSRERAAQAPKGPREDLLRAADRLLAGEWRIFSVDRHDVTPAVDWHCDPKTGTRAPGDTYSFSIPFAGGASRFDTKYVWELSRHHQTTVLAMAYWLTGDERYARAAVDQIQSWVRANPFLAGIHWASGIELGMRLIAFAWTRRLLGDWPEAPKHFEDNEAFARAVVQHQWLLAHHGSYGSSANNHLIYEMAGLYVSTNCMPWHGDAGTWRERAARTLESEFPRQIFPEGYTRELASDYNGFVLEALIICLCEAVLDGVSPGAGLRDCAQRMLGWLAANCDSKGRPPRQGDSDDATGLLLDTPGYDRWHDLLYFRSARRGRAAGPVPSLRAYLLSPLAHFEDADQTAPSGPRESGLVVLRARAGTPGEIWCAFDAGPLGYLSIAAHGHADALALELRYGGVPVLVDPGTFAYSGPWRDWFRSTAAHNTVDLGGVSQSESGGPFLWTRHAAAKLLETGGLEDNTAIARVVGEHDGYGRCRHRRSAILDRCNATLTVHDEISSSRPMVLRMSWHLHPEVACRLSDGGATLTCRGAVIRLALPRALAWRVGGGGDSPGPGWYSPSFDVRQRSTTLLGEGRLSGSLALWTAFLFPPR